MYNIICELRETASRGASDPLSGSLLGKFKAKIFRDEISSSQANMINSNAIFTTMQFKYFGVDINPNEHTIIMDMYGDKKARIIRNVTIINPPIIGGRCRKDKTIYKVILQ